MEGSRAGAWVGPRVQVSARDVVNGVCVVRYDNEVGKGDHRHFGQKESTYAFQTPEKLIADFQRDIVRWNRENRNS
jgi:hypothetical protein